MQTCDHSTLTVEAGISGVQDHPLRHSKFDEVNQGYVRSCLRKKKNSQPELQIIYNSLTIWTVERASCEDRKIIWGLSCSIKEQMEPQGNEEEENMITASGMCHYSLAETKPYFPLRGCLGLQKNAFTQEDTSRPVEMAQCLWALRGSQFYSQDPHGYPTFSSDLLGLLHACGEHTSCLS